MGYTLYVEIPKNKILIEISRHAHEPYRPFPFDIFEENWIDLDNKFSDLTVKQVAELVNFYQKIPCITNSDELLLYWLEARQIHYRIISEYTYEDKKKDYEGWFVWDWVTD
jgi:hypothetical protein